MEALLFGPGPATEVENPMPSPQCWLIKNASVGSLSLKDPISGTTGVGVARWCWTTLMAGDLEDKAGPHKALRAAAIRSDMSVMLVSLMLLLIT
jgi:hypothetical protein